MKLPFRAHSSRRRSVPAEQGARRRAAIIAALAVAALLCAGRPARAGTITALLNGTGLDGIINPGADVTINLGDGSTPNIDYHPGVVNWKLLSNNSALPFANNFTTFCIELTQDIAPNTPVTYTLTDLASAPKPGSSKSGGTNGMGATKATEISELWGQYYNSIGTNDVNAAAFQLAIWKIENDWGDSSMSGSNFFTSGNFRATDPQDNNQVTKLATQWLAYLEAHPGLPPAQGLWALTSPSYQDQVTQVPPPPGPPPPSPVPAPPGLCLAGAGALCLAGYFWRRKRVAVA
jgi:hypothetical protein